MYGHVAPQIGQMVCWWNTTCCGGGIMACSLAGLACQPEPACQVVEAGICLAQQLSQPAVLG